MPAPNLDDIHYLRCSLLILLKRTARKWCECRSSKIEEKLLPSFQLRISFHYFIIHARKNDLDVTKLFCRNSLKCHCPRLKLALGRKVSSFRESFPSNLSRGDREERGRQARDTGEKSALRIRPWPDGSTKGPLDIFLQRQASMVR